MPDKPTANNENYVRKLLESSSILMETISKLVCALENECREMKQIYADLSVENTRPEWSEYLNAFEKGISKAESAILSYLEIRQYLITNIEDLVHGLPKIDRKLSEAAEKSTKKTGVCIGILNTLRESIPSGTDSNHAALRTALDKAEENLDELGFHLRNDMELICAAFKFEHDEQGNLRKASIPVDYAKELERVSKGGGVPADEMPGIVQTIPRLNRDDIANTIKVIDTAGGEHLHAFDKVGQLIGIIDPMGNTTVFTYSPLGKIETITDPLGGLTKCTYYPGGRLESVTLSDGGYEHYTYDPVGNIIKITNKQGNETNLAYDALNRVTSIMSPLGYGKRFVYDAVGQVTAKTDENDNTTAYAYSLTSELTNVTDPLGHTTSHIHDKAGRLIRIEHDTGLTIAWDYSPTGRVTNITNPLSGISSFKHDPVGNIISKIAEDGTETFYEYNAVNQLSKVKYDDGKITEFTYGSLRQLKEIKDWLGTTTIETDALGRAVKVTDHKNRITSYTYDALSRRKSITYPDGTGISYRYNKQNQLEKIISRSGTVRYIYDDYGRVAERKMPNGISTQYTTDPLGRLLTLTHMQNGELLDKFSYTYDPVGNIIAIDKYRRDIPSDCGLFTYSYDALNRLTEANSPFGSRQYHYDSLGNRIASIKDGIETKYTYNFRNQLVRSEEGETVRDYAYDLRGNLNKIFTNDILTEEYIFDATNRLTAVVKEDGGRIEYVYNGLLKRTGRFENPRSNAPNEATSQLSYMLDLTRSYHDILAIEQVGSESPIQRFIWGDELLMSEGTAQNQSFSYLNDHLGSPIRLVGGIHGQPLAYDEFGVPSVEPNPDISTSFNNPFGFTGYQMETSGLYFAQSRFYNPMDARFVREDFINDGLNWYSYCGNNPLRYVDQTGLYRSHAQKTQNEYHADFLAGWPYNTDRTLLDDFKDIGAAIVRIGENVISDICNFSLFNKCEIVALDFNYFSAYKGQLVIRSPLERPGAFGAIFMPESYLEKSKGEQREYAIQTVRHEWGHNIQLLFMGPSTYLCGVFIPSVRSGGLPRNEYYNLPYERMADILGGVIREGHTPEAAITALKYNSFLTNPILYAYLKSMSEIPTWLKNLLEQKANPENDKLGCID